MSNTKVKIPTKDYFVYDRLCPPLFFAEPTEEELPYWLNSMSLITREYFKMSRKYKISAQTPLSNGMTAGEYGMWLLLMNHQKRNKNSD